jgi:hypothetical protein
VSAEAAANDGGSSGSPTSSSRLSSHQPDVYGFIDGTGRGMLDVVVHTEQGAAGGGAATDATLTIEMELFVRGDASSQVLPVVTPTIQVELREAPGGNALSCKSECIVTDGGTAALNQAKQDGTRAGTRHVLPVPVPVTGVACGLAEGGQPPLGLYITELTGAHVRFSRKHINYAY